MSTPRLLALATLASLAASLSAQSLPPWDKVGMRVQRWRSGSTLELGTTSAGDCAIALRFRHDADLGAVLTSIGHRSTALDGTVSVHDFAAEPLVDRGLWKAEFRTLSSEVPITVTPADTMWCTVWTDDPNAPSRAIFQWYGLDLGGVIPDSLFWMELKVVIDPQRPDRAEWASRLGRIELPFGGEPVTLDEVKAPILHIQQPGPATRLLVPVAGTFVLPATNMPMGFWAFNPITGQPIDLTLEHPARGQQMQFSAMYSHNPGTSFRKIAYFSTEDTEGHYKRFRHTVVPGFGGALYRWESIHFPVYGPAPRLNFHRSEYPSVLTVFEATGDTFWYDVAARYREFVEAEMGLKRIVDPAYPLNPDFVGSSVFVATSIVRPAVLDSADHPSAYAAFLDQARLLGEWFKGADGGSRPLFMEWQKWLKGTAESPVAEDPIGPGHNPAPFSGADVAFKEPPLYVRAAIADAHAAGINMSMYTVPSILNDDDWATFDPDWYLRQRDGSLYPIGALADGNHVDFGHTEVPQWFASVLYDDYMNAAPGLGGAFFDLLGGASGSFLRYPSDPGLLFKKRYHGGTLYVKGAQRLFDLTRARIARDKPSNTHPDIPFLATETAQEFFAGKYDFAQHGLKPIPHQMALNPLFDLFGGFPALQFPDVSNPSPPMWHAVYHEWSRAEGLTVQLSTRATQFGDVSYARWGDYMRMVHALWWFQGMKMTSFQYLLDNEDYELIADHGGGIVGAADLANPYQRNVLDFLLRLHQATDRYDEAGQFLLGGRMERPLQMPNGYFAQSIDASTPSFAINNSLAVQLAQAPGVLHFYENAFTTGLFNLVLLGQLGYPMPRVMHSVWRSADHAGKLGVVFVNWADTPAFWQGIFDPAKYGLGADFVVKGLRPDGAGVVEYVVGQGHGPTQLYWGIGPGLGLQHHSSPAPFFMPPRSAQVFLIEPL